MFEMKNLDYERSLSHHVSNKTLFFWRVSCSAFYFCYITWRASIFGLSYWYSLFYSRYWLTDWNWTVDLIYFVTASVYSYTGKLKTTNQILFAIVHPLMWIVTLIFWTILAGPLFDGTYASTLVDKIDWVIGHSMNFIPPMIDLFLSKTVVPKKYIVFGPLLSLVYFIMLFIIRLTTNYDWPYQFIGALNCNGSCPTYINYPVMLGIVTPANMAVYIPFFLLLQGIIRLRDRGRADANDDGHLLYTFSEHMKNQLIDVKKPPKVNEREIIVKSKISALVKSVEKVQKDKVDVGSDTEPANQRRLSYIDRLRQSTNSRLMNFHKTVEFGGSETSSGPKPNFTDNASQNNENCDSILLEVPSTSYSKIGLSEGQNLSIPLFEDNKTPKTVNSVNHENQIELSKPMETFVESPKTTEEIKLPEILSSIKIEILEEARPSESSQLNTVIENADAESFQSGSSDIGNHSSIASSRLSFVDLLKKMTSKSNKSEGKIVTKDLNVDLAKKSEPNIQIFVSDHDITGENNSNHHQAIDEVVISDAIETKSKSMSTFNEPKRRTLLIDLFRNSIAKSDKINPPKAARNNNSKVTSIRVLSQTVDLKPSTRKRPSSNPGPRKKVSFIEDQQPTINENNVQSEQSIFGQKKGKQPFFEDIQTLDTEGEKSKEKEESLIEESEQQIDLQRIKNISQEPLNIVIDDASKVENGQ